MRGQEVSRKYVVMYNNNINCHQQNLRPILTRRVTLFILPVAGQPFQIQPYIDLVDFGSNIISSDSSTVVSCIVVPSLAVSEGIVVTTTSSPVVNITKVSFSEATLTKATASDLGPGDKIVVEVSRDLDS